MVGLRMGKKEGFNNTIKRQVHDVWVADKRDQQPRGCVSLDCKCVMLTVDCCSFACLAEARVVHSRELGGVPGVVLGVRAEQRLHDPEGAGAPTAVGEANEQAGAKRAIAIS